MLPPRVSTSSIPRVKIIPTEAEKLVDHPTNSDNRQ